MISSKIDNLAIIIVTYNRYASLKNIVERIYEFGWNFEAFIIVDNCSTDSTESFVKELAVKDRRILPLMLKQNIGHGAAISKGIEVLPASTSTVLLLEDDSYPASNLLTELWHAMEKADLGLVSSGGYRVKLGKRLPVNPSELLSLVDFALLDGALIKRGVIDKVGGPVSNWFMMFDDYEYCYRIRMAGFKIGVLQSGHHDILHLGGGEKFSNATLWRGYYQARNHTFFLKMHFNAFNLFDFLILQTKRLVGCLGAPDWRIRLWFRVLGVWHGIKGKEGKVLDPVTLKFGVK
jgi:GT2 family glycosyltransferase